MTKRWITPCGICNTRWQGMLFAMGVGVAAATFAQAPAGTSESMSTVVHSQAPEKLANEVRSAISGLADAGAFGATAVQDLHLDLAIPAQRVSDLGLLVDSGRISRDGVLVVGVTPGLQAESMGLRGGDRILSFNQVQLAGVDSAVQRLRDTVAGLPDRADVALTIERSGRQSRVTGTVSSRRLPAMRLLVGNADAEQSPLVPVSPDVAGCGRLSDFDVAPRQRQLHAARVLSIDGKLAGPTDAHVFRVGAGRHTLEVGERIDPKYLPFNDRQRQAGVGARGGKSLQVDVPANTTLLIAAKLNAKALADWRSAAYWEPVVWKAVVEACR